MAQTQDLYYHAIPLVVKFPRSRPRLTLLGTFKEGVSKQGVTTFACRPGSQYDVTATRGPNSVLASDCRAQFGRASTRRRCRICVTVRLPVRPRGETKHWQANANTPLSVTPLVKMPDIWGPCSQVCKLFWEKSCANPFLL